MKIYWKRIAGLALMVAFFGIVLASTGYSVTYTACVNNVTISENISVNNTMVPTLYDCPNGCDVTNGRCYDVDWGYALLGVLAFIVFICSMFWISNYFKPKPSKNTEMHPDGTVTEGEEMNLFMYIVSFGFLCAGLLILGFLLSFIGGLTTGFSHNAGTATISSSLYSFSSLWFFLSSLFILGGLMLFIIAVLFYTIKWWQYNTFKKKQERDGV